MRIDNLVTDETPWLGYAISKINVREIAGPMSSRDIMEFHAHTFAGVPPKGDETAWCASFAGWCLMKSGYPSTRSKSARSYAAYGQRLSIFRLGAVYVFDRADPRNPDAAHVGFALAEYGKWAFILGGNQANSVNVTPYSLERLVERRWPLMAA